MSRPPVTARAARELAKGKRLMAALSTPPTASSDAENQGRLRSLLWRSGDTRRLLMALAGSVVLGLLATWLLPYAGVPQSGGPLDQGGGHGSALSQYDVGDRFTYGMNVLAMPDGSTDKAIVRDVRVVGLDEGMRFLDARLGGPERKETWQVIDGFPPSKREFAVVPLSTPISEDSARSGGRGWELLLGFEITKPGYWVSDGWEITYEVNGRAYRYVEETQMVVCTRAVQKTKNECWFPGERGQFR
jgi:hypothetical protein